MSSNVIGLLILYVLLLLGVIKLKWIEKLANLLLKNLSFFFIVPGVTILGVLPLMKDNWWKILIIVVLTTIIVMGVVGKMMELLIKKDNG